jgi:hypothetical protein
MRVKIHYYTSIKPSQPMTKMIGEFEQKIGRTIEEARL